MLKICSLLLFLANYGCIVAQTEETPFSLGWGGGIDVIWNKDEAASPLPYEGFGLPVGINGGQMAGNWMHRFELRLILPLLTNDYPLKSKANTRLRDWTKVDINYQLLRRVGSGSVAWLGGGWSSQLFYRTYHFLDGRGWEWQNSMNVIYAHQVSIRSKSFLLPQVSLPVVGFIHRRPTLTYDEAFLDDFYNRGVIALLKYGRWLLPSKKWLSFEFNVFYLNNSSDRWDLQGAIGFNVQQFTFPERVRTINVPLRWYLNYQW